MESDKQVISRVLSGDDDAYGELITRYQGPLFGMAMARLRDPDRAREAAADALTAGYLSLSQLKEPSRLDPGSVLSCTAPVSSNSETVKRAHLRTRTYRTETRSPTAPWRSVAPRCVFGSVSIAFPLDTESRLCSTTSRGSRSPRSLVGWISRRAR